MSAKLATGAAACEWSRGRLGPQPSPARTGGASTARIPGPFLRPPLSAASKIKLGTAGKDDGNTLDMPSPRVLLCTTEGKCISYRRGLSFSHTLKFMTSVLYCIALNFNIITQKIPAPETKDEKIIKLKGPYLLVLDDLWIYFCYE